ncbi:NYN domain-containing protein [Synechococcus sp. EJ6-Ellesmere]|nr:NYN domain-containing protein [Synechococcus sp. EJ6-Ellesmere]
MDLLHSGRMDGFWLVSSDNDVTRLAARIRAAGLAVYAFGEKKTPKPFVAACDKFIDTEILRKALSPGRHCCSDPGGRLGASELRSVTTQPDRPSHRRPPPGSTLPPAAGPPARTARPAGQRGSIRGDRLIAAPWPIGSPRPDRCGDPGSRPPHRSQAARP